MTIEEIQARLDVLASAMADKGLIVPEATVLINSGGRNSVLAQWRKDSRSAYSDRSQHFSAGDTLADLDAADAWVAALPTAESLTMTTYLGKLADAVDYGHSNGIPDEYVDPVRITQKAMSDNLLGAPE